MEKLTDMIYSLLKIVWGEDWGTFSEEKPTDNDPDTQKLPHITYSLAHRQHMANRTVKRTQFASEPDPEHEGHNITYHKNWFTCELHFTIYHDTNKGARQIAERFEEFMDTYVGYFKQEGVSEIIFKEELAPNVNSDYRQDLPYRTLIYEANIERTLVIRSYDLHQVDLVLLESKPKTADDAESPTDESQSVITNLGLNNFLELYNQNFPSPKGGN